MKKLLSIAVASLALAAVADSFSPNIGVTTLQLTRKNNVIPVQYTSLADNGAITADALVCTNNIEAGSHLYIFQGDSYTAWTLGSSGWEKIDVSSTKPDGISAAAPDANQTLATGSAIWLSFKDAPTSAKLVSIYGAVADGISSTIVAGTTEKPVSSLVCNLTNSSVTSQALTEKLAKLNPENGDKIQFLGESSYNGYYNYNGINWEKIEGTEFKEGLDKGLGAYEGFWYVSVGGAGTITW